MLIDLHTHTRTLSADSSLEPYDLIATARIRGLDGVCFTDHDRAWPAEKIAQLREQHDFLVLSGMEVSTNYGHVLVFGLSQHRTDMFQVEKLRGWVENEGALMFLAHPYRGIGMRYPRDEETITRFFDGMEVLNGSMPDGGNGSALELAQSTRLRGIGGSDAHTKMDVGSCVTEFSVPIRNEGDLIAALRNSHFAAVDLRQRRRENGLRV